MIPQTEHRDVRSPHQGNGFTVNRPLPTLSSSTSPGLRESPASQSLTSPTSPPVRDSAHGSTNHHPSVVPSKRVERSESPASTTSNRIANFGHKERETIIQSYAPHVAVYASTDVEQLVADKGLGGGLAMLLRPFGEQVQGKVVIRDSHGISRAWDDFGIRVRRPDYSSRASGAIADIGSQHGLDSPHLESHHADDPSPINWAAVLDSSLNKFDSPVKLSDNSSYTASSQEALTDAFQIYLQKILSSNAVDPFETFNHPVACIIAVSSRNPAPIETLRQLYGLTGRTNSAIPAWISTEYLRYYVLVHDEDKDDISKSAALFDQMKRHFGLHCHLLRLRSSTCAFTDDDSFRLPAMTWLSAEESQALLQREERAEDFGDGDKSVFESDANAITAFVREMVTQSVIPFMENRVAVWNDQVASRKRGIGGRFMSMSKRWAGFGSLKASGTASSSSVNANSSNYNSDEGFYAPETPEAIMRSLADHAMMLRDWKLAYNTYDLMRSDFSHDKAWAYHAAAYEMLATSSLLLTPQQTKLKLESVDQWLEAAVYSYLTHCFLPSKAKRCLLLCMELLHGRDMLSSSRAPTLAARLLEISVVGAVEQCLIAERCSNAYSIAHVGSEQVHFPRHASMWALLGSISSTNLDRRERARLQLQAARDTYHLPGETTLCMPFPSMRTLWQELSGRVEPSKLLSENIERLSPIESKNLPRNPSYPSTDTFVLDKKSHSRRPSHFARKSEGIDTIHLATLDNQDDGFE